MRSSNAPSTKPTTRCGLQPKRFKNQPAPANTGTEYLNRPAPGGSALAPARVVRPSCFHEPALEFKVCSKPKRPAIAPGSQPPDQLWPSLV
jgi:hypothetical protein